MTHPTAPMFQLLEFTPNERRLVIEVVQFKIDKIRLVMEKIACGDIRLGSVGDLRIPSWQDCINEIDVCEQVLRKLQ